MPPKSSKRPREEEPQKLDDSLEKSRQYRTDMTGFHRQQALERTKFERKCTRLLDDLVLSIEIADYSATTRLVTEYFDLKCEYEMLLTNIACFKRMTRETNWPHVKGAGTAKAAPPVPDKTPQQ